MRLWEADHAYYCNEGNYCLQGCGAEYKRWSDYHAAEGDADMDYNLLFRWDWVEGTDEGAEEFNGDVNYRNGILKLFYMGQRKGIYRFATVQVCRADEPEIRAWLLPRMQYLMDLWSPLVSEPSPTTVNNKGET
ncbi:hypothetical protein KOAAANKH_02584 [Brevundimonas sp. NIBR10]|nr:hypothetical protein KOAAANKH_02584 [Brevundimonas sp. NIBR10]